MMGRQFMTDFDKGAIEGSRVPAPKRRKNRRRSMNKVDKLVAELMLSYPTIFPDRFKALRQILTSSEYAWKDGCLVRAYEPVETRTPEDGRNDFVRRIEENRDSICRCHYVEAVARLNWYDFVSEHLEVCASEYVYSSDSHIVMGDMLGRMARSGMDFTRHSPIMNKPEVVDQEWNDAISGWLSQLIPTMNNLWSGNIHEDGPLKPSLGLSRSQLKTWETVYYLRALYYSDLDRKRDRIMRDIASRL
jgi:hypothetical protein